MSDDLPLGSRPILPIPEAFAGYQVIKELHRGGQGIVYLATQVSTHRNVAIKVMKEGPFASAVDKVRFDREVQTLGQLKHSNIVTIHGTGFAAGHHYFVMDYIPGQALDAFVASASPSIRDLLRIFVKICDAVNAAHLRAVIHRDLKPSNIRIDEVGEPHILDFGLARSAPDGPEASAVTATGLFVGSLPWASPEQAEGAGDRLDLRSDVYSIGVVLYQALTGRFPYNVVGSLRDVLVRIVGAEPVRPRTLRSAIDDEVETIILKCLEKDPDRRYQTAGELARDLRHYLCGEPIEAKRDSTLYVIRKQLRRHVVPVAIGAAFLITILVGLITAAAGWKRAASERDTAEASRAQAQAVTAFLVETLGAANPYGGGGPNTTINDVLRTAVQRVETSFQEQPLVQAAVFESLSGTYDALGDSIAADDCARKALELRQRELPPDHPDIAQSLCFRAQAATKLAQHAQAEEWARESLRLRQQHFGDRNAVVVDSLLALGIALSAQGRELDAEPYLREAAEQATTFLGAEHRLSIFTKFRLAACLFEQLQLEEARPLLEEVVVLARQVLGADHPDLANILATLGEARYLDGDNVAAEAAQDEALAIRQRIFGREHVTIANSLSNLALLYLDDGRLEEAERSYRESLDLRRRLYGPRRIEVTFALIGLARVQLQTSRPSQAETLLREALGIFDDSASRSWRRAYTQCQLGVALLEQDRFEEAEPLLVEGVAGVRAARGDRDRFAKEVLRYAVDFYDRVTEPEKGAVYERILDEK